MPVVIDYHEHSEAIAWDTGAPGLHDFLRVLGRASTATVSVHVLDPLEPHDDRKTLARAAAEAIERALAASANSRPAL